MNNLLVKEEMITAINNPKVKTLSYGISSVVGGE